MAIDAFVPGVLYQHVDMRPFRLSGYPGVYIGYRGGYFCQDMEGRRYELSPSSARNLMYVCIPVIPPDMQLPEGF